MSRLQALRAEYQLTQIQVQLRTTIDQSDYSKIERGDKEPTYWQSKALSQLYHTSLDYIAGLTNVRESYPPCQGSKKEAEDRT